MEPIVNNNPPPKPADLDVMSNDNTNTVGGSPVNLPNGLTKEAILSYARNRNSTWDKWFTPKFKRIEENWKLWRNMRAGGTARTGANPIPLAVGYAILESVLARLNTTLLSRPKYVEAVSEIPQNDNGIQSQIEDFINQQLTKELRKPETGKSGFKSALLNGYVIFRSVWKREAQETSDAEYKEDPTTKEQLYMGEKPRTAFKEYWTARNCNPSNMAWDIHTTTKIDESSWVRERDYKSYNEFLVMEQNGELENVEQLKNITPSRLEGGAKEDFEKKLKRADGDPEWRTSYADEKLYQIDEWHAYMSYQDKDAEDGQTAKCIHAHFYIVENNHLMMFDENVLKPVRMPYKSAQLIQDPDSIIGLSLLEAIKPLLDSINVYAAKQQQLVEWCSNPTIFYGSKSGLAGRTTFSRPMGMQPVNDASDIKEFLANPASVKVVQEYMQFLISQARESSGANEQFQGIDGADTATEFQGLQAAAGSRFADIGENLNQGLIEPLGQEAYWMYRQFGVDGQMVFHPQTEESAAVAITKQMFQGEYRFVANTASTDNYKQRQIQDDTNFLQMMGAMNGQGGFNGMLYNVPKHVTEISLPMRGQKSSKDMFTPAPPPQPQMLGPKGPIPVPEGGFVNLPMGNQGVPMDMAGVAHAQGPGAGNINGLPPRPAPMPSQPMSMPNANAPTSPMQP